MDKSATKAFRSASSKFSTLSTNKTFLYVVAALAAFTVIGYLATNQGRAVIFFALVAMITSRFTTNMSVILLIAVLATSFLVSMRAFHKGTREGMEDGSSETTESTETTTADENADVEDKMDPAAKKALAIMKTTPSIKDAKKKMAKGAEAKELVDEDQLPMKIDKEEGEPEPMTSMTKNQNNTKGGGASRIDYASTLESAYGNLESALGSGGINKLTKDTAGLMSQQKELFQSMQQMTPLIEDAKSMLQGLDMKSLSGLANMAAGVDAK
jgi:hypothetical protein